MPTEVLAVNGLNSFGLPGHASTQEQIFILRADQLQEIISRAVQPLQDEVSQLKATVARQQEDIASLRDTSDLNYDDIRDLYAAIAEIEQKKVGKTEISRAEKIETYLRARPDHRATLETLKGYLGIGKVLLYQTMQILITENPGKYAIIKTPGARDKRKKTLVLLPR